jgi:hypothetical protein
MTPDSRFSRFPKVFWANVRHVSQEVRYTERGTNRVKIPTIDEILRSYEKYGLKYDHLADSHGHPTPMGQAVLEYLEFRASILNDYVEPRLMTGNKAARVFYELRRKLQPRLPVPMNKQKGEKRKPAFLTGIVNMIVEANLGDRQFEHDPRRLTTISNDSGLLRTLSRWYDGAYPSSNNPIAIWEVKEYYHTTTFGSRVADGVYESLLDGMELEDLRDETGIHVNHYLILDDHFTWWECGKAYLCRIIDMLHMGYVDEVFFGYEVVEQMPAAVRSWVR